MSSPSPSRSTKKGSRDDSSPVSPEAGETRESTDIGPADFKKDEDGKIPRRPSGQKAETGANGKGTGHVSVFDFNTCPGCPRRDKCPVNIGKRKAGIFHNEKTLGIAGRRKHRDTPEFKRLWRKRSGAEAANSVFARKRGLKRLRARGSKRRTIASHAKPLRVTH
ncbi:MAG: transposase [Deltaproteobacteria bacterium]|nr:transposase [Deltaproteobacteria bacterium]